jgi:hypothetical protein
MPDVTLPEGLIESAKALVVCGERRRPKQADLRRSVSASYFAAFHALARMCADVLIGKTKRTRPNKAWVEVYRGLDHGKAKTSCQEAKNVEFPQDIKDFADAFQQLQAARHGADYDPMIRLSRLEAVSYITLAEDSIAAPKAVNQRDKLAFAAWVTITSSGAQKARGRVKAGRIREI